MIKKQIYGVISKFEFGTWNNILTTNDYDLVIELIPTDDEKIKYF